MSLDHAFIFIGAPGSGKGTVIKSLEEFGAVISTRGLLEENAHTGFIQESNLAPDDLMCRLLIRKLRGVSGVGMIDTLRSKIQCDVVWQLLSAMGTAITTIHLRVDDEVAIRRMKERGRPDDIAAEKRLADYHKYGPPVLEWLKPATDLIDINANRPMLEVIECARRQVEITLSTRQCLVVPDALRRAILQKAAFA